MSVIKRLACLAVLGTLVGTTVYAEDWVDTTSTEPRALYEEKCGMCHQANGMGTTLLSRRYDAEQALLENRRDLEGTFIRTAVRSGFNNMFPISRGEVSDAQLDSIVAYLTREAR